MNGVRLSGEVAPLTQVMEHALTILGDDGTERGKPEYWFLTAPVSGVAQIGFSPIPDDSYTVEIFYKPAQVVSHPWTRRPCLRWDLGQLHHTPGRP